MDQMMHNLLVEKKRIALTDEMSNRVGIDREVGRRFLATEIVNARNQGRQPDMAVVAWAIKDYSEK
jgi:hypothetical protein